MRIRVLSDLHLEFKDWKPPKADADVVVLAGDIHVGVKGIEWARLSFPSIPIVYVPAATRREKGARQSAFHRVAEPQGRYRAGSFGGCPIYHGLRCGLHSLAHDRAILGLSAKSGSIRHWPETRGGSRCVSSLSHTHGRAKFGPAELCWSEHAGGSSFDAQSTLRDLNLETPAVDIGHDGQPHGARRISRPQ
jgi:hypothetical protein